MNIKTAVKNNNMSSNVKTLLCCILLFVCAALFVPKAGVFRTIPFFVIGGIASKKLGMTLKFSCFLSAVFTLCLYLAYGKYVSAAVVFAAVSALLTGLGILFASFLEIALKTKKKTVKAKCLFFALISLVVSVFISMLFCGNPVSFIEHDKANTAYLTENYGDTVEKKYTSFSSEDATYRTYVKFYTNGVVHGAEDDCYVNEHTDGIRDVFLDRIALECSVGLSKLTADKNGGFYVAGTDFVLGETLSPVKDREEYVNRLCYVLAYDSLLSENDEDKFVAACEKAIDSIEREEFEFYEIVLCGGDASDIYFGVKIKPATDVSDVSKLVTSFDDNLISVYGMSKEDILSYWQN